MKTVLGLAAVGSRTCGSLSIDVRGVLRPHAIVRCGGCGAVKGTWRSYLEQATKDEVAVGADRHDRHPGAGVTILRDPAGRA
jgi:hypothetical protein